MNTLLRERYKQELPEYHSQPLHLTTQEIATPQNVLQEFFDRYHLPDIRFCMKEWLDASLKEDEILPLNFVSVHDDVLKVLEAAWVMSKKE